MERRGGWGVRVGVVHLPAPGGSEVMENQRGICVPSPHVLSTTPPGLISRHNCCMGHLERAQERGRCSGLHITIGMLSYFAHAYVFRLAYKCIYCININVSVHTRACAYKLTQTDTHMHAHAQIHTT